MKNDIRDSLNGFKCPVDKVLSALAEYLNLYIIRDPMLLYELPQEIILDL